MLKLHPNCELCDRDLPPDSPLAMICSYECTFCAPCVTDVLKNVCPNCGGKFERRPRRPGVAHRSGVCLNDQPASETRVHTRYSQTDIEAFSLSIRSKYPNER